MNYEMARTVNQAAEDGALIWDINFVYYTCHLLAILAAIVGFFGLFTICFLVWLIT